MQCAICFRKKWSSYKVAENRVFTCIYVNLCRKLGFDAVENGLGIRSGKCEKPLLRSAETWTQTKHIVKRIARRSGDWEKRGGNRLAPPRHATARETNEKMK